MPLYPIHVPRKSYRGSKPAIREKVRARNELAARLERHINEQFAAQANNSVTFIYGYIAHELHLDVKDVQEVLFGVECGHNGLTVFREHLEPGGRRG